MNLKGNKTKIITLISIILVILVGIGFSVWYIKNKEAQTPVEDGNSQVEDDGVYRNITLYYANKEYIEKGDEKDSPVVPVEVKVNYKDKSIEQAIIDELYNVPETGTNKEITTVLTGRRIIGVEKKDKIVYVNFANENLSGGSLEETLITEQIINSLLSVQDVKGVKFLVDGQEVESLMGHNSTEYTLPDSVIQSDIEFIDFQLGMTVDKVLAKLGTPNSRNFEAEQNIEYLAYDGAEFMTKEGIVYEITVTDSKYPTRRGLKVGDGVEQVIKIYGTTESNNRTGIMRYKVGNIEALYITINSEGRVEKIRIIEP